MAEISKVAVIGAGTMGGGIAQLAAARGVPTSLCDPSAPALERARAAMERRLRREVEKGSARPEAVAAALGRVAATSDLAAAAGDADLVIEAVPERRDLKLELFRRLDALAPAGALLASNTSSISITELAAATRRPERCAGLHFMNPPPVMPLIELIRGAATSQETAAALADFARRLGKTPVEASDSPGFVSNRVLMPMINEAIFCVHEGVAEAAAVDEVMKLGMRHPLGPLALADFIGLDVCLDILETLQRGLGEDKYRPCPLLRRMVAAGWLGKKSGRGFYRYSD